MNLLNNRYKLTSILVIFLIFIISCEDTIKPSNDNSGSEQFSQDCVDEINRYRATENLDPLDRWRDKEYCVATQAINDSEVNKAHDAFGDCDEFAQNECPGYSSEESILNNCLKQMWDEGPGKDFNKHGHYLNMTNEKYTKVACNYYRTPEGKYWAIMNFR